MAEMNLYAILRTSGWRSADDLADAVLVRPDPEPAEV